MWINLAAEADAGQLIITPPFAVVVGFVAFVVVMVVAVVVVVASSFFFCRQCQGAFGGMWSVIDNDLVDFVGVHDVGPPLFYDRRRRPRPSLRRRRLRSLT